MAGWPKKNEEMRIYRDRDKKSYFIVIVDDYYQGAYGSIANTYSHTEPPNPCYTSISHQYISSHWLKRVQWDELPENYRDAFTRYMNVSDEYPFNPDKVRGFWKVGNQPQPVIESSTCPRSANVIG